MNSLPFQRLLVMGDSIAAGIGDPVDGYPDQSWADQLARALPGAQYLNLGRSGARAAEIRDEQLGRAVAWRPDLAVVAAGGNDALRRSFDRTAVATELTHIVAALHAVGAVVATFGCMDVGRTSLVPPEHRGDLSERLHDLGRITEAVTTRYGGVYVSFLDHPAPGEDLFSADNLHANRRGHALIVRELLRALAVAPVPSRRQWREGRTREGRPVIVTSR